MWTPRRILLCFLGFTACMGVYIVYVGVLGRVNGLPPLPDGLARAADGRPAPPVVLGPTAIQGRLQQAFGPYCLEQHPPYAIKLEVLDKGIVFAAHDARIENGVVHLTQMSVAIFGKNKEISTLHCDRAILRFDAPVRKIDDMGSRKVTEAELYADAEFPAEDDRRGTVEIINNRKSYDPRDDLKLRTPGPVVYRDKPPAGEPHIITAAGVTIYDGQNRAANDTGEATPLPTVTADGLRVFLAIEQPGAVAKPDRKPAGSVTGVERVLLDRNVTMNLYAESKSMFGGTAEKKPVAKGDEPPEKTLIRIETRGPFAYDMPKDEARFEIAPPANAAIPEYVKVNRQGKGNNVDTLLSDVLEIRFQRKAPPKPTKEVVIAKEPAPKQGGEMDIEQVHAWGKFVLLSSDAEKMHASGNDLVYDAVARTTRLRGQPFMRAMKDGHSIEAPELFMTNMGEKGKQTAIARGKGMIGIGQTDPKSGLPSANAYWQESLTFRRVTEEGREMDLLILTGNDKLPAMFRDKQNNQQMDANLIKLWVLPSDDAGPKEAKVVPGQASRPPRPYRMEATGLVAAASPDVIIEDCDTLLVRFKDVGIRPEPVVIPVGNPRKAYLPGPGIYVAAAEGFVAQLPDIPVADLPVPNGAPAVKEQPKQPIVVKHAQHIETWVNRIQGKNELDRVRCSGKVRIHQDPTPENEHGVDIDGNTVEMEHFADGNYLLVTGTMQEIAEIHFDKLLIFGNDIAVDQRNNTALVKGAGNMQLLSGTDLNGKKLAEAKPLNVYWNDSMELNGPDKRVRYEGKVSATQDRAKVNCEMMQVTLDRPLWLNPANRPKPAPGEAKSSPKVERVVCDQTGPRVLLKKPDPVVVIDEERLGDQLVKFQRVEGAQVEMNNDQNKMEANGPGVVRTFQAGAKEAFGDQPARKGKPDEEMKLTTVQFRGKMDAFRSPQKAIFYDDIEVVHSPANAPNAEIDITKLPPRAIHLTCKDKLVFLQLERDLRMPDGSIVKTKWHEMEAQGNVRVRGEDFEGWATQVNYSEEKGTIIFYGVRENLARFSRSEGLGGARKNISGRQIVYNLKTKDFQVIDGDGGGSN